MSIYDGVALWAAIKAHLDGEGHVICLLRTGTICMHGSVDGVAC